MEEFQFSDEIILNLIKVIQLSILTGTDVLDHLRLMKMESNEGKLFLTEKYKEVFDEYIEKLLEKVDEIQKAQEEVEKAKLESGELN